MKKVVCFICLWLSVLSLGCGKKQPPTLHLFFTTDMEGVFWSRPEPHYGNEVTGGLAVLKSFLDKQTIPFLLLEGGNWFSQTPEGTLSKGEYFNELSISLPYSARLFTEKDLMYGWASLQQIIKKSPAPFVVSNVRLTNGKNPSGLKPWIMEEIAGVKVGVLGVLNRKASQGKQRLGGLKIEKEIESVRQTVQTLREKGADVVVLLSGLGASDQKDVLTDISLAEEIADIDVIISANLGREAAEATRVGKTWIVYSGSKLDSIGKISLFFNKDNQLTKSEFEDVVLYRRDYGEDELVESLTQEVRRTTRGQMNRPVGELMENLNGHLDRESSLGNWAADCLKKWAKTDVAIINSDSLRDSLSSGTVTQYDLYRLYPYADNITYLTMKGAALLNALEEGLEIEDNFAQVAGLEITYAPNAQKGKRILNVKINGQPISQQASYRVAVTDHMLAGGTGHDGFIDSLEFKNTQVEMRTVLRLCLAGNKKSIVSKNKRWRIYK